MGGQIVLGVKLSLGSNCTRHLLKKSKDMKIEKRLLLLRCSATEYINLCITTTIFLQDSTKIIDILRFLRKKKKRKNYNCTRVLPCCIETRVRNPMYKKLLRYSHNNQFKNLQS